jgi:hypothetical protein
MIGRIVWAILQGATFGALFVFSVFGIYLEYLNYKGFAP